MSLPQPPAAIGPMPAEIALSNADLAVIYLALSARYGVLALDGAPDLARRAGELCNAFARMQKTGVAATVQPDED